MDMKEIKVFSIVKVLLFSSLFHIGISQNVINNKKFPADFLFGTATAAFQIEGGWDADGKGESMWDYYSHQNPDQIADGSNANVACDSYHKYKEDVAMMKNLGVNAYRFSISWPRVLPTGFPDIINQPGVIYYKNLINELKDNNIEPLVTLMHGDVPQALVELGGPLNASFSDWFADWSRVAFTLFGDDVKYWMTLNEPREHCVWLHQPGVVAGVSEYECARNLIRAHAAAWHTYDDEFRAKQGGKVTIVLNSNYNEPESNKTEDVEAADRQFQFNLGWFAHPIYLGDYPEVMKTRIADRSKAQGFTKSRLRDFSEEEKVYIKGTADYFAINTYTTSIVAAIPEPDISDTTRNGDIGVNEYQPSDWSGAASAWLKVVPWGIRKLLNWIKDHYNNPDITISENGFSDNGTTLQDDDRIYYLQNYLSNIKDAMDDDDVNVTAYLVWSLMDNFEWNAGYTQKFGLHYVDFNDPNRTRTAKKSVSYYQKVTKTYCLVDECIE